LMKTIKKSSHYYSVKGWILVLSASTATVYSIVSDCEFDYRDSVVSSYFQRSVPVPPGAKRVISNSLSISPAVVVVVPVKARKAFVVPTQL